MASKSKRGTTGASGDFSASKIGSTVAKKAINNSSGRVQVIYQGKIVTPQSLAAPKKSYIAPKGKAESKEQKNTEEKVGVTIAPTTEHVEGRVQSSKDVALKSVKSSIRGIQKKEAVEDFCTILLSETPTTIFFSQTALVGASDTRDVIVLDERNERYEATVKAHENADGFVHRPTQTINLPRKSKSELARPNPTTEMASQAESYSIIDATKVETNAHEEIGIGTEDLTGHNYDHTGLPAAVKKYVTETVTVSLATPGCMLDPTQIIRNNDKSTRKGAAQSNSASQAQTSQANVSGAHQSSSAAAGTSTSQAGVGDEVVNRSNPSVQNASGFGASGSKIIGESSVGGGNSSDVVGKNEALEMNVEKDSTQLLHDAETKSILSSTMLLKRLQMVERAVQQNANHRSQLDYRDLPDITPLVLNKDKGKTNTSDSNNLFGSLGGLGATATTTSGAVGSQDEGDEGDGLKFVEDEDAKVKKLFRYSNDSLTQGRSVTAMCWNGANQDLLAVGYGKIQEVTDDYVPGKALDEEKRGGLVLFWSLRNPDYPEKILKTNAPVTALDFSTLNPMILGVGLLNGDVNIYDVKREGAKWSEPIESSAELENGHSDPVWQLTWIMKGTESIETLVSISTDGSVLEWNIKKGLIVTCLMQLKKSDMGEGWITKTAAALCFDFNPADPNTYVAGTEDGNLHRCSVSYNEQYLDTYKGHDGPVQKVKFSDCWPSAFLSCSTDWTANLYHLKSQNPLLSFRATGQDFSINDICWCPDNSTVFACCTNDAKIQLWDLSVSSIDPVVTVDTTLDDEKEEEVGGEDVEETDGRMSPGKDNNWNSLPLPPGTSASRYDRLDLNYAPEDDTRQPVEKLLKNLSTESKKKSLTSIKFGKKVPIVVVGDSQGTVTVYRVYEPMTITHQGPIQQLQKLMNAVTQQTDPENAETLQQFADQDMEQVKTLSNNKTAL